MYTPMIRLNASAIIPTDVTLTIVTPDPKGALTLNPDGSVDVAAGYSCRNLYIDLSNMRKCRCWEL